VRVIAHPDPFVLEAELLERVAALKAAEPLGRALLLVPTARLASHIRRRLAHRIGACLEVEVLHHRALVREILESAGAPVPEPASEPLLLAVLSHALERLPNNAWSRFASRRPGAIHALLAAVQDLREAGITPAEAESRLTTGRDRAFAEVFRAYEGALARLGRVGIVDEAERARAALPCAAAYGRGLRLVVHHGAYELIGIHLDLVRALDAACTVQFLLPAEPGAPVSRFADAYAERHLLAEDARIERLADRAGGICGERLGTLFVEDARPAPLPGAVALWTYQGADAEADGAVRAALAAVAAGESPLEIAIIAPSLTPYGGAFEAALDDPDLPWTSSLSTPLTREPHVHDLAILLRVAADDFPRALTATVLGSPRLRWDRLLGDDAAPPGDRAEAWSRQAGVVRGIEAWTQWLPAWAAIPQGAEGTSEEEREEERRRSERRRVQAERIGRAVAALAARLGVDKPRRWAAHARAIRALAADLLQPATPRAAAALDQLQPLLDNMARVERIAGDRREVSLAEAAAWFLGALEGTAVRWRARDDGGVRVLDAMQARGLTFRWVALLGMHGGSFPRAPRADPILPDAARLRLRDATRKPLPVKSEAEAEERLLLSLLLGSAGNSLRLSWQRADEKGREKAPSLALREVSRIVYGRPDLAGLVRAATPAASHPAQALAGHAVDPGVLAPEEDLLLAALRGDAGSESEAALVVLNPDLAPGLAMLRATESFVPGDGRYDGRVDGGIGPRLSVSALAQLGRCPLQFFFARRLGIRDLANEPDLLALAADQVGKQAHRLLERLYRRLADEGRFAPDAAASLLPRALELLPGAWRETLGDATAPLARRFPVLWRSEERRWGQALTAFLRDDLARLRAARRQPVGFELTVVEPLTFGPFTLAVEGRFDRVMRGEDGTWVGDYKTGASLMTPCSRAQMLKGKQLQVPLYQRLAGAGACVELLGIGPRYDPARLPDEEDRRQQFTGFEKGEGPGFDETMATLIALLRDGRLAMRPDDHCGWCDYRTACRQQHPPTRAREEADAGTADVRGLEGKSTRAPLLAQVAARATIGAAEEDA
jgi:ATP-dependent helicase/nuclease subunit B